MVEAMIEKTKKGDKEAFSKIVEIYYDEMFLLSVSLLKNPYDADDACQEAFIKAYKKIKRLRNSESFKSWLAKIVWNHSKDILAKRKNEADINNVSLEGFINEEAEEKTDILKYLFALKDEYREVLTLRYFHEMKLKEIAKITRTPLNTVKSRIRYALDEMRKMMEGYLK